MCSVLEITVLCCPFTWCLPIVVLFVFTDVVKLPDDDLLDTTLIPAVSDLISDEFGKYSTMPRLREREPGETCQLVNTQKRPVSMAGL